MTRQCEDMRPWLSALQDNELDPDLESEVREHLQQCLQCRQVMAEYEALSSIVVGHCPIPEVDAEAVWQGIKSELPAKKTGFSQRFSNLIRSPWFWPAPAAAALAMALFLISHLFVTKPAQVATTEIETISSAKAQVMALQSEKYKQPIIWLMPEKQVEDQRETNPS